MRMTKPIEAELKQEIIDRAVENVVKGRHGDISQRVFDDLFQCLRPWVQKIPKSHRDSSVFFIHSNPDDNPKTVSFDFFRKEYNAQTSKLSEFPFVGMYRQARLKK